MPHPGMPHPGMVPPGYPSELMYLRIWIKCCSFIWKRHLRPSFYAWCSFCFALLPRLAITAVAPGMPMHGAPMMMPGAPMMMPGHGAPVMVPGHGAPMMVAPGYGGTVMHGKMKHGKMKGFGKFKGPKFGKAMKKMGKWK